MEMEKRERAEEEVDVPEDMMSQVKRPRGTEGTTDSNDTEDAPHAEGGAEPATTEVDEGAETAATAPESQPVLEQQPVQPAGDDRSVCKDFQNGVCYRGHGCPPPSRHSLRNHAPTANHAPTMQSSLTARYFTAQHHPTDLTS